MKKILSVFAVCLFLFACSKPQPKPQTPAPQAQKQDEVRAVTPMTEDITAGISAAALSEKDKEDLSLRLEQGVADLHQSYISALKGILQKIYPADKDYPQDGEDFKYISALSEKILKDYGADLESLENEFALKLAADLKNASNGAQFKDAARKDETDYSLNAGDSGSGYASAFGLMVNFYGIKDRAAQMLSKDAAQKGLNAQDLIAAEQNDMRLMLQPEIDKIYGILSEGLHHKYSDDYAQVKERVQGELDAEKSAFEVKLQNVMTKYYGELSARYMAQELYKKYDKAAVDKVLPYIKENMAGISAEPSENIKRAKLDKLSKELEARLQNYRLK